MADLNGIIPPPLPQGGQWSNRQSNNSAGQNVFSIANPGQGGGFFYGTGDPSKDTTPYTWSSHLYDYMAPDKIIPSQYTMTPQQAVGQAQYFQGAGVQAPKQFTTSQPSAAPTQIQEQGPAQGFIFGQQGTPNYKFMAGSLENNTPGQATKFFAQQPDTPNNQPTQGLGVFTPWQDPRVSALINQR